MPKSFDEQLPGQLDRALLEVVAEGEVAEHLEEGVVARGVADVVEVVVLAAGAHALLRGRRRVVGARLLAGEHVLELHHAGVGEHQGRIVARHKRRRRHDLVALLLEEIEERSADLVDARHRIAFGISSRRRRRLRFSEPPPSIRRTYPSGMGGLNVKRLRRFLPREAPQPSSRKPTRSGGYPGPSDRVIEAPARPAGSLSWVPDRARHSPRASGMTDVELGLRGMDPHSSSAAEICIGFGH